MHVLTPAGPQAGAIADIAWVLFAGATAITALVVWLVWRAVRSGPRPVNARHWIVGGGLLFPVAVLAALMAFSQWRARVVMAEPPADALVVGVTGRLWWWEVHYAGTSARLANEIRVPVGRTVWLGLSSADVIHSLWLPQLAGKMDLVPGRVNRLVFRVDAPGTYRAVCAEFCGEQHARMGLHLVAMAQPDFEAWLRTQAAPAAQQPARGRDDFLAQQCQACHTVRGVAEQANLGPDLTHVGSRVALGAGTLANSRQALADWVAHTQDWKPGARMPDYGRLDRATVDAIADWLWSMK